MCRRRELFQCRQQILDVQRLSGIRERLGKNPAAIVPFNANFGLAERADLQRSHAVSSKTGQNLFRSRHFFVKIMMIDEDQRGEDQVKNNPKPVLARSHVTCADAATPGRPAAGSYPASRRPGPTRLFGSVWHSL